MSESQAHLLLNGKPSEQPSATGDARYRLRIEQAPGGCAPRVRVEDPSTGRTLLEWTGALARHLLQAGALPPSALRCAHYDCDKALIRHLTLTGAAAQLALNQIAELESAGLPPRKIPALMPVRSSGELSANERLARRLGESGRHLPGPHLLVAKTLFARRGEHFSEPDVVCLLSLECPSMRTSLIHTCLDELTAWNVIQRIVIDEENVFYDIDMRPHLHIFDPATRRLSDAPRTGVVSLEASA